MFQYPLSVTGLSSTAGTLHIQYISDYTVLKIKI